MSVKTLLRPLLRAILSLFFKRKYLQGRFFDESMGGYVWGFRGIFVQKILGFNRHVPWPCHHTMQINKAENLIFHPDNIDNFQSGGIYFQNPTATITLGKGSYIAPNTGFITRNHDPENLDNHLPASPIVLGENCWIGMNSVVLPGVTLGPNTIVGAGSVVTKSFPQGHVIIAGSPAKVIKTLSGAG